MKEWKYLIGSADDFIGAPEWATLKTKSDSYEFFLEHAGIGAKFINPNRIGAEVKTTGAPAPEEDEVIIAQRTESFGNAIDLEFCKANPDHPNCKCKQIDISQLISDRGNKYGAFKDGAEIMRDLKNVMHSTDGWERLSPSQQESLDMIQHKIGRILNGDPNYDDNWKDIAGYAILIAEELSGNIK